MDGWISLHSSVQAESAILLTLAINELGAYVYTRKRTYCFLGAGASLAHLIRMPHEYLEVIFSRVLYSVILLLDFQLVVYYRLARCKTIF